MRRFLGPPLPRLQTASWAETAPRAAVGETPRAEPAGGTLLRGVFAEGAGMRVVYVTSYPFTEG